MEITEQYRKSVISKALERTQELKVKYEIAYRVIAKNIGINPGVLSWLANPEYHSKISKKSILILADFVNNKIYYDSDKKEWKNPKLTNTEEKAMETVKKMEVIRKEKQGMATDNKDDVEKIANIITDVNKSTREHLRNFLGKTEKYELGFWELIDKAVEVIPSNVSIKIKINSK